MRRYLFVVLLVVALATLAIAMTLMGPAGAFPTWGDDNNCDAAGCHQTNAFTEGVHTLAPHAGIVGTCSNCHTGTPADDTVDPSACLTCHGGGTLDGLVQAHPDPIETGTCGASTACHAASVSTTTTAGQTTTTAGATTTTAGEVTTTTDGGTTTTVQQTTTTRSTVSATTSTTLKKAKAKFTG